MPQNNIFDESILISGIMCDSGCGVIVDSGIKKHFKKKYNIQHVSLSSELYLNGIHKIAIYAKDDNFIFYEDALAELKGALNQHFIDLESDLRVINFEENHPSDYTNRINITLNIFAIISIIVLSIIFPPSLFLSLGLAGICLVVSAVTARIYILNFLRNLREKKFFSMNSTVTFGWLLSAAHTIYHLNLMPAITSISMTFMMFIMPLTLVTIVNVMDEIKRLILQKSSQVIINGMPSLFPELQEEYLVKNTNDDFKSIRRGLIETNSIVLVKKGECFPVDGILESQTACIDTSILDGEFCKELQKENEVCSGYINLGDDVEIRATRNSYDSMLNSMLFRSNRIISEEKKKDETYYFYFGLIALGCIVSLALSLALGIFTVVGFLQISAGILFAVCPCTVAIAHHFPLVLSTFSLQKQGILMRDSANVFAKFEDIDTYIFDKTGTLTSHASEVISVDSLSDDILHKIYSIEKTYGQGHLVAEAITSYFENNPGKSGEVLKAILSTKSSNGLTGKIGNDEISIGSAKYIAELGLQLPTEEVKGASPIYIFNNQSYQGKILIKHKPRQDIICSLQKLKKDGKKLILLTGDTLESSKEFNRQIDNLFEQEDIIAGKDPKSKAEYISRLINKNICFVGDRINDAECAKEVTQKGGISCSIRNGEKSSLFTDISLNDSLKYLFLHKKIKRDIEKTVQQNEAILVSGAIILLLFLISFPLMGINMPALIPMLLMFSTTVFTVINSYRLQIKTQNHFTGKPSFLSKFVSSDLSMGLLLLGGILFAVALLIASMTSLHLSLPMLVFSGGISLIISNYSLLASLTIFGGLAITAGSSLIADNIPVISSSELKC